jgi:hypothetical protein
VEKATITGDKKLQEWLDDRDKIVISPFDLTAMDEKPPERHRQPTCRFV